MAVLATLRLGLSGAAQAVNPRGYGGTVARLTADQKVRGSNLFALILGDTRPAHALACNEQSSEESSGHFN